MMWGTITISILLIIFLIFRRIVGCNKCDNRTNNEYQAEKIDTAKNVITSISDNDTPIINGKGQEGVKNNNEEDVHYKSDDIIWTAELIHIKSIMFLRPSQTKRASHSKSNTQKLLYKKQESLTPIKEYELAVWFAELIGEADNLHEAKMFAEEREYCLNAIKWCAKENVSILYWQDRLNQVNEILGIKPIDIADKSGSKKETDKKYLSASDKYELYKSFTNPLEAEYQYHHSNKNIAEEQKVVQKAIKFARENNLIYYEHYMQ